MHLHMREEAVDEEAHHLFDRDEALLAAVARQADKALHLGRQRHQSVQHLLLAGQIELGHHGEAEVRHEGEGMRRIDGDRRQHREDVGEEVLLQPGLLPLAQLLGGEDADSLRPQFGHQAAPAVLLIFHQPPGALVDRRELLRGGQTFLAGLQNAGPHLPLQAGDAHHVELVEVGAGNRQKTDALQQRMADVVSLLHHALVEFQPGNLPVDEALGRRRRGKRGSLAPFGRLNVGRAALDRRLDLGGFLHRFLHRSQPSVPASRTAAEPYHPGKTRLCSKLRSR